MHNLLAVSILPPLSHQCNSWTMPSTYLQVHKRAHENSMHSPRAPFILVCDVQAGTSHLPPTCTHTCLSSYLWVVFYLYLYDIFSQPAENDFYSPEMCEVGTVFTCGSWIFLAFHTCDRTCKYWTFSFWPTVEIIKLVTFWSLPVLNKWNREQSTMAIKWCEQLTTIPITASMSQDDMRTLAILCILAVWLTQDCLPGLAWP